MAKFRVDVSESVFYQVIVEADDSDEAEELAVGKLCESEDPNQFFDESTGFAADRVVKLRTPVLAAA